MNRDDVRVRECGDGAGLLVEARHRLRIARQPLRQELQRDMASEPGIARSIHLAHATRAEKGDDFIRANVRSGSERHGFAARLYGGSVKRPADPTMPRVLACGEPEAPTALEAPTYVIP